MSESAATETPVVEQEQVEQPAEEQPAEEKPAKREKKPTISYVVAKGGEYVKAYRGAPVDVVEGDIIVWTKDHMSRVPTPVLVTLYNTIRPEKPITKFRDRKAAENTMWPTLEVLAGKPLPGAKAMAAAKKGTKTTKTTKAAKTSTGAGRTSAFSGKTITRLVDKNPRREGTHGFKSFALIKDGMTYDEYIKKGGRRNDLDWDIKHKYVKLNGK